MAHALVPIIVRTLTAYITPSIQRIICSLEIYDRKLSYITPFVEYTSCKTRLTSKMSLAYSWGSGMDLGGRQRRRTVEDEAH